MNISDHFQPTLKKSYVEPEHVNSALHNSRNSEEDDDFIHANKTQNQTGDGRTKTRLSHVVPLWLQS